MPDIIDIILDRLSVSSLELLDEINLNSNRQSQHYSKQLEQSLDVIESVYLNRCSLELRNKTDLLISKTREHKILLDKYSSQFKEFQTSGINKSNSKKMEAYNKLINSTERRLNELTKDLEGDMQAEDMFIKIHDMHKKIEDFEMKITEIKKRLHSYENFPASFTGAQNCVADLKSRIKEKETILERNLY